MKFIKLNQLPHWPVNFTFPNYSWNEEGQPLPPFLYREYIIFFDKITVNI